MAYIKHAKVLLNGREDAYCEDISFPEASEHVVRRFAGGGYAFEKSKLIPQATISFSVAPMPGTTNQPNYRGILRQGTVVVMTWVGGDNRITTVEGLVSKADERDPKETGHLLDVEITGVVTFGSE